MLINLLSAFNANASSKPMDEDVQTSFNFDHSPAVIFVRDTKTLTRVDNYKELDEYVLSEKDKEKVSITLIEIENSGGYDGDQLLIDSLSYNPDNNIIYIVAKKTKYSFLKTLQKSSQEGGFDESSVFYKMPFCTAGVRVPFITEDDHTFFIMRNKSPQVYSVAAGYLEAPPNGELHPKEGANNLVTYIAYCEALDEFLGHADKSNESLESQFQHAKVKIKQLGLAAIAVRRKCNSQRLEIEFINPLRVCCDHKYMKNLIENNKAKDASEHVSTDSICVPLDVSVRKKAVEILEQLSDEGKYVRDPLVAITSILANPSASFFPRYLPGKLTTEFIHVSLLKSVIHKPLLKFKEERETAQQIKAK